MSGPPLEIYLDPNASPRYVSTPSTVPLHWQEKVKADINRTPRRCLDLQPLNKHCQREKWVMTTPSKQARSVPRNTYKTVTDAWNGYHSVPLRNEDRHLTTFITPWGCYRYCRNPQGFVGAGDGYNRRFDAVLSNSIAKRGASTIPSSGTPTSLTTGAA